LIVADGKVENRGTTTRLRGEVAIHAGKTPDLDEMFRVQRSGLVGPFTVLGAVLAVADLVDCHVADQDSATTCCQPYGWRRYGDRPAHHLVFANVRRLPSPVACRGQLWVGWTVPTEPIDVERAIRIQLSTLED
jgi:hypothetical protein